MTRPGNHLLPCGCLTNSRDAHRRDCPDFETLDVGDAGTSNRLDDLRWKPRETAGHQYCSNCEGVDPRSCWNTSTPETRNA